MKTMRVIFILSIFVLTYAEPPPPSNLYGAPSGNGNGNNFGMFIPPLYTVPSSQFEPPLPDTHSATLHTFQQSTTPDDSHKYYSSTPSTNIPSTRTRTRTRPISSTPRTVYVTPALRNSYVPPQQPSSQYGAPQQPSSQYGAPQQQQPSSQYGAPAITGAVFPSDKYGPPSGGNSGYSYNNNGGGDDYNNGQDAKYEFEYMVKDEPSGNDFGHRESRDGTRTEGRYYVLLPDGRRQVVTYYADETGYHPTITYEDTGLGGGQNGGYNYPNNNRGNGNGNSGYSYNGY